MKTENSHKTSPQTNMACTRETHEKSTERQRERERGGIDRESEVEEEDEEEKEEERSEKTKAKGWHLRRKAEASLEERPNVLQRMADCFVCVCLTCRLERGWQRIGRPAARGSKLWRRLQAEAAPGGRSLHNKRKRPRKKEGWEQNRKERTQQRVEREKEYASVYVRACQREKESEREE